VKIASPPTAVVRTGSTQGALLLLDVHTAAITAVYTRVVLAHPSRHGQYVRHVVRVGVADAVRTGAFHQPTVRTPHHRPVTHVVVTGVVDAAGPALALCGWVDVVQTLTVR
jgi:hypothetical protein